MFSPQTDEEEFIFYFKLAKPLVLNLSNTNDRIKAAAWIRKLRDDGANPALRTSYLKLLLFMLQRRRLIGPFAAAPDATPLGIFPAGSNLQDIAKNYADTEQQLLRETLAQGGFGEWPPYTIACSTDLTEYAATQEIPNFGTQAYFAISKEPLRTWDKFAEEAVPKAEKVASGEPDLSIPPDASPDISTFATPEGAPTTGKKLGSPAKSILSPPKTPSPAKERPEAEKSEKSVTFDAEDKDFAWLDKLSGKDVDFQKLKEEQDKDEFTKEARIPPTWGSNLMNVTDSPAERRLSRAPSLPYLTPPVKTYKDYMKSVGMHELPFRPKPPRDSLERQKQVFPKRAISPIREHDVFQAESPVDFDADILSVSFMDEEEYATEVTPTSPPYADPSKYLQGAFSPEAFSPDLDLTSTPKKPIGNRRILHSSFELRRRKKGKLVLPKTKLAGIHELERFIETPEKVPPRLPIADIDADISDPRVFQQVVPGAMVEDFEEPSFYDDTFEDLEDPAAHLQGDVLVGEDIDQEAELRETSVIVEPESVTIVQKSASPAKRVSPRRISPKVSPRQASPRRTSPVEAVSDAVQRILAGAYKPTPEEVAKYIDDILAEPPDEVIPTRPAEEVEEIEDEPPAQHIAEAVQKILDGAYKPTAEEVAKYIDEAIIEEEEKKDSFIEESEKDYKWMAETSTGSGFPDDEEQDAALWESFGWWTDDPNVIFQELSPTPTVRSTEEFVSRFPTPPRTPPLFSRYPSIREGLAGKRKYAIEEFGIEPFEEPVWIPAEQYFRGKYVKSPFRDPRDVDRQSLLLPPPLKSPIMKTRMADIPVSADDIITETEPPDFHDVPFEQQDFVKMSKAQAMFDAYLHGKPKPLTADEKADLADPEQLDWSKFNFFTDKPPRFILEPPFLLTPPKYDPNPDIREEDLDESISKMLNEDLDIINAKLPVTTPQRSPLPRRALLPEAPPFVPETEFEVEPVYSPELKTPPKYVLPPRKEVIMDEKLPTLEDLRIKSPPPKKPKPVRKILYRAPGVTDEEIYQTDLMNKALDRATLNYERRLELVAEIRQKFASPPSRPASPPPERHLLDASITEELPRPLLPPSGWTYSTPPRLRERAKLHVVTSPGAQPAFSADVGLYFESPPEAIYSPTYAVEDLMESPDFKIDSPPAALSPMKSPGGRPAYDDRAPADIIQYAEEYPEAYGGDLAEEQDVLYESPEQQITPEHIRKIKEQEIELGMRQRSPRTIEEFQEQMLAELQAEVFGVQPAQPPSRRSPARKPPTPESPETPELQRKLWRQTLELHKVEKVPRRQMVVRPKPGKAVVVRRSQAPFFEDVQEQIQEEEERPAPRERMFVPAYTRVPVVSPKKLQPTLYSTKLPSPHAKYVDYGIGSPVRYEPRKVLPLTEEGEPEETDQVPPSQVLRTLPRRRLFQEPESPESPEYDVEPRSESPEKQKLTIRIDANGRVVFSPPFATPYNWDWTSPPSYKQKVSDLDYYSTVVSSPLAGEAPPSLMYSPEREDSETATAEGQAAPDTGDIFDYYAGTEDPGLETEVLPELNLSFEMPKGKDISLTKVQIVTVPVQQPSTVAADIPAETESVLEVAAELVPTVTITIPSKPAVAEPPAAVEESTRVKKKPGKKISFAEFKEVKLISPKKMYGMLGKQKSRQIKIKLPPPPSPPPKTPSPPPPIVRTPSPPPPGAHLPATPEYVHRIQMAAAAPLPASSSPMHPLLMRPAPVPPPVALPPDTGIDIGSPRKRTPPRSRILYKAPGITEEDIYRDRLFERSLKLAERNYKRRIELVREIRERFASPPRPVSPPPEPHLLDEPIGEELPQPLLPPSGWTYSTPPRLRERSQLHVVISPRAPMPKGFSEDVTLAFESPPEAAFSPTLAMEDLMESPDLGIGKSAPDARSPIRSPGGRPAYDARAPEDIIQYTEEYPEAYEELEDERAVLYESPERVTTPEHKRKIKAQEIELGLRQRSPRTAKEFEEQMLRQLESEVFGRKPTKPVSSQPISRSPERETLYPLDEIEAQIVRELEEQVFGLPPSQAAVPVARPGSPVRVTKAPSGSPPRMLQRRAPSPESPETPELQRRLWRQSLELHKVERVRRRQIRVRPKPGKAVTVRRSQAPFLADVEEAVQEEVDLSEPRERMFIPAHTRVPIVTPSKLKPTLYSTRVPSPGAKYVDHGIGSPRRYEPKRKLPLPEPIDEYEERDIISPERLGFQPRRRLFAEPESPESPEPALVTSPETQTTRIRFGPDGQIIVSPLMVPPPNWDWTSPPSYKQKVSDLDYYSTVPTSPLAGEAPPRGIYSPEKGGSPLLAEAPIGEAEPTASAGSIFDYYAAATTGAPDLDAEIMPEVNLIVESPTKTSGRGLTTKVQVVTMPVAPPPGLLPQAPIEEMPRVEEPVTRISTRLEPTVTVTVSPEQAAAATVEEAPVVTKKPSKKISFAEYKDVKLISPKKMYGMLGKQPVQKVKIKLPPPPTPPPRVPSPPPAPVVRTPSPPPGAHLPATPEYVHRMQIGTAAAPLPASPMHPILMRPAAVPPPLAAPPDTGIDIGSPRKRTPPKSVILYKAPGVTEEDIYRDRLFEESLFKAEANYKRRLQLIAEIRKEYVPQPSPPREASPPPERHLLDQTITEELPQALLPPSGWTYSTPPKLRERAKLHIVTSPRAEPGFSADVGLYFESPPEAAYSPTFAVEHLMGSPDFGTEVAPKAPSPMTSPGGRPMYDTRIPEDIVQYAEEYPEGYTEEIDEDEGVLYESPEHVVTPEHMRRIREQEIELGLRQRSPRTIEEFQEQLLAELQAEVFGVQPEQAASPPRSPRPVERRAPSPESPGTPEQERKAWRQTLESQTVDWPTRRQKYVRPRSGKTVPIRRSQAPFLADVEEAAEEEEENIPEPRYGPEYEKEKIEELRRIMDDVFAGGHPTAHTLEEEEEPQVLDLSHSQIDLLAEIDYEPAVFNFFRSDDDPEYEGRLPFEGQPDTIFDTSMIDTDLPFDLRDFRWVDLRRRY